MSSWGKTNSPTRRFAGAIPYFQVLGIIVEELQRARTRRPSLLRIQPHLDLPYPAKQGIPLLGDTIPQIKTEPQTCPPPTDLRQRPNEEAGGEDGEEDREGWTHRGSALAEMRVSLFGKALFG